MSYCTVCDNAQNPCPDHPKAHRYLDPILYERSSSGSGWRAPDHERERWEAETLGNKPTIHPGHARSFQELETELDRWMFISDETRGTLEAAYEKNALKTTRLVEATTDGAQNQTLQNPSGYLVKHARQIAS